MSDFSKLTFRYIRDPQLFFPFVQDLVLFERSWGTLKCQMNRTVTLNLTSRPFSGGISAGCVALRPGNRQVHTDAPLPTDKICVVDTSFLLRALRVVEGREREGIAFL